MDSVSAQNASSVASLENKLVANALGKAGLNNWVSTSRLRDPGKI